MAYPELVWLAEQAQSHVRIAELGSFLGRSTCALASNTEGQVWAIDNWEGPDDVTLLEENCSMKEFLKNHGIGLYPQFHETLRDLIEAGKIIPVKADHRDAHQSIALTFDMVFIDGSHKYEDVKRDIWNWMPKLTKGGLLSGHDMYMDGVMQALTEIFHGNWHNPTATDIWYLTL